VDLRHLRYFVIVAEELNVTRAASRLHIAQPSLSMRIRKLESEVGTELFAREGRGIKLTDAGRIFLEHARKTLLDANRGIDLARQAANGESGHLSIGFNAPAGFNVFPRVVPAFRKQRPNVQITFHTFNILQQLEGLRRDQLDVAVVWLPIPTDEFEVHELMEEPLLAILPADHRLAKSRHISFKDLSGEPMILPSRLLHPDTFYEIEQRFLRAGATLNVVYQLESSLSMMNFVAMGMGCSLLPAYARNIQQDGVVLRPLMPADFTRTLAIIKKKDHGALAEAFVRFTLEVFGQNASAKPRAVKSSDSADTKRRKRSR
jgi:LysR family hca operon transcriptional activator